MQSPNNPRCVFKHPDECKILIHYWNSGSQFLVNCVCVLYLPLLQSVSIYQECNIFTWHLSPYACKSSRHLFQLQSQACKKHIILFFCNYKQLLVRVNPRGEKDIICSEFLFRSQGYLQQNTAASSHHGCRGDINVSALINQEHLFIQLYPNSYSKCSLLNIF